MKKLLKNAIVVTMDANNTVWKKGWVLVNGSVIEALGEGEYNGDTAETEVIDMSGKLVMPGFVNAHSHFAGSLFKGLLEDRQETTDDFPDHGTYSLRDRYPSDGTSRGRRYPKRNTRRSWCSGG